MRKTIDVTLRVVIEDLDDEARHRAAYEIGLEDENGESTGEDDNGLPGVEDVDTDEFVDLFRGNENVFDAEFFAGSGIYAKVVDVDVITHTELKEEPDGSAET